MGDPITAPADHPEFALLNSLAEQAFAEALEIATGSSEPGAERHQAFYYAANALLNKAAFKDAETVAQALGFLLGAVACHVGADDYKAFVEIAVDQAVLVVRSRQSGRRVPPIPPRKTH